MQVKIILFGQLTDITGDDTVASCCPRLGDWIERR